MSHVSLLKFYLYHLPIAESGALKIPAVIVVVSVSPFRSVSNCLLYLGAQMLGAYTM